MMRMRIVPLLLAVFAVFISPTWGWIPRADLVSKKRMLSFGGLKAMNDDDETTIEAYRAKLETRFNAYGDHAHDFFSEMSPLFDGEEDWMESEWSDETTTPCGEDCEECEIPEEFRVTDVNPVDVMAFLQIRRAEPLRVERRGGGEWE